jgi:hypothetical protein
MTLLRRGGAPVSGGCGTKRWTRRRIAYRTSRANVTSTKIPFGSALRPATAEIKHKPVFTCWLLLPAAPHRSTSLRPSRTQQFRNKLSSRFFVNYLSNSHCIARSTLRSSLCHRVDNLHSFVLGRESKFRMFRLEVFVEMILGSISIESLSQTDERTYPTREQTVAMALRNERTLNISVDVRVRMTLKTSHVRIRTTTLDMRTLQCAITPRDRNGDRTAVLSDQGRHYLPHLLCWSIDPRVPHSASSLR